MFSKSPNQNVAIMMATYNGDRFLVEQIDSILTLSTSCFLIRMTYGCLIRLTLSSRLANMLMTMD